MAQPHRLDGPRLKIERAKEHIADLKTRVAALIASKPYRIATEYDLVRGHVVARFSTVASIPPMFSILIGEAVYQIRSALDHLVWQLIVSRGETPPTKSGFPIFTLQDGYKARKQGMIKGVSASAEARIKALQPYRRGAAFKNDPLWILQEMNNTDKHRLLVVSRVFMTGGGEMRLTSGAITVSHGAWFKAMVITPIKDGAELMRIQAVPKGDVQMDAEISMEVLVKKASDAKPQPVIPLLTQLADFTSDLIESFASEFQANVSSAERSVTGQRLHTGKVGPQTP